MNSTDRLRVALMRAALQFQKDLLEALAKAPLGEIEAIARPLPTNGGTRSPTPEAKASVPLEASILASLDAMGTPMAASTLALDLGVPVRELVEPLRALRAEGRIVLHGRNRSAVYALD